MSFVSWSAAWTTSRPSGLTPTATSGPFSFMRRDSLHLAPCPGAHPAHYTHAVRRAMTVTIQLSSLLQDYCGGASEFALEAASVRAVLGEIERRHPKLYASVCNETGAVRSHVNLFVNAHNIRDRRGLETPLAPGDVVTILQAVSGG